MRFRLLLVLMCLRGWMFSQAPALIPYQAIARGSDGQQLSNATILARFTIHDVTATGPAVWQEMQSVSTSALGLFTVQLGSVMPLTNVNWSGGNKFMQVEIDLGQGYVDMGTQQMLSVPYALHASSVRLNVSSTGDTLFIGDGNFVIVPGISEANSGGDGNAGGTAFHSCGVNNVHNTDLVYGSMTDQEGNVYKTIVIGTQEWMAENLNTSIYRNGEVIATNLSGLEWGNTINNQQGAWTYYNNDESYACPYGKLYNWFACVDSRQLCPVGWHVPTDEEWSTLILLLDPAYNPNDFFSSSDVAGIEMKTTGSMESGNGYWYEYPQIVSTNSSGFSGVPSGSRSYFDGAYRFNGSRVFMWSTTQYGEYGAYYRKLCYDGNGAYRSDEGHKSNGYSVRCVHD